MTARKRAPGGGRKAKGPFKGKTATLTTRIRPDTRAALDQEAKRKGLSLSQEVERRLDQSLHKDRDTPPRIRALAHAVTLLASSIEQATDRSWLEDAFAGAALRHGIDALIFHFAPTPVGGPAVPPKVEEAAARLQPKLGETYRNPELLGGMQAGMVITSIERAADLPTNVKLPADSVFDPWGFGKILRDVGSGWQRNRNVWNKEAK